MHTHRSGVRARLLIYPQSAHGPPTRFTSLRSLSTLSSHTRTRRKNCPSQARLANTRSTHSTLLTQTQRRSLPPRPPLLTPKASLYPHAWLSRPCISPLHQKLHTSPHHRRGTRTHAPLKVSLPNPEETAQREAHHTKHTHRRTNLFCILILHERRPPCRSESYHLYIRLSIAGS